MNFLFSKGKLKKNQIEDLEKFYTEWSASKVVMKGLKENTLSDKNGTNETLNIDPYEMADTIDIFIKFNDAWAQKVNFHLFK